MKPLVLLLISSSAVLAQEPGFVYPVPGARTFATSSAIYKKTDTTSLGLDLYRPATVAPGYRLPVLIIVNGIGASFMRTSAQARGWAEAATAHGFAAVTEETTTARVAEDVDSLFGYLRQHADSLHVDPDRVAVIAWSANVSEGLRLVEDSRRTTIKAGVFYYGYADVRAIRQDVPVLVVRAGLDQPTTNRQVDQVIAAGLASGAPWEVVSYPAGHHAFDLVDDNDYSREVIEQTFQFLRRVLSPSHGAALRAGLPEATAGSALAVGDFEKAAALYGPVAASHPQSAPILLAYGNALLGAKRYHDARAQFDRVKAIGTAGPRDLGLPAARACALDNDPDAAIAWLKSIPSQFLPDGVQSDPDFASLNHRADFQALFRK